MSRTSFAILMASIAAVVLLGMWLAWRGRKRRGEASQRLAQASPLSGEIIAEFPRASYVSTTPAGSPLERIAIPGLRYKGYAAVTVRRDGVTIAVTGEPAVHVPSAQLRGSDTAGGRVGKFVEPGGLSLLQWSPDPDADVDDTVESSFRLADGTEQRAFADAIAEITGTRATGATPTDSERSDTTQEEA